MSNPIICITTGDPFGIGNEITAKFIDSIHPHYIISFLIIGSKNLFLKTMKEIKTEPPVIFMDEFDEKSVRENMFTFLCMDDFKQLPRQACPTKEGGLASFNFLSEAIELAFQKKIDALVTCPISKKSLNLAKIPFRGHTEILANKTASRTTIPMFVSDDLRVSLTTGHIPLKKIQYNLTISSVKNAITLTEKSLREDFGIMYPRIAVLGLNPHSGENGVLGSEEVKIIKPTVESMKKNGIQCDGPFTADSFFIPTNNERFDAVIAMFHDQALIPFKMKNFYKSCQLTLGIPFIRTSVIHGTAFDIAGKNKADYTSLKYAVELAQKIIKQREVLC